MTNSTYKVVEVIGSSPNSWEEATRAVIEQTLKHLEDVRVARVVDQDVRIEDGKIVAFRTKLSLSFRFHDPAELSK